MSRARRILLIGGVLLLGMRSADARLWGSSRKSAAPSVAAPEASAITLTSVDVDGARMVFHTTSAPAYTSYSPSPGVFVVDLTGTTRDAAMSIPATLPPAVESVVAENVVEMGNRLARLTFRLSQPVHPDVSASDKSVIVTIPVTVVAIENAPADTTPAAAVVTPDPAPVATTSIEPVAEPAVEVVEPVAKTEEIPMPRARNVRSIDATTSGGAVQVRIAGDGALKYKAFRLEGPSRLVIDLDGVKNGVAKSAVTVNDDVVKRVRVAQFQTAPPVARVVIDLAHKTEYTIDASGDELRVAFGGSFAPAPATTSVATYTPPPASAVTVVADAPEPVATPVKVEHVAHVNAPVDIPSQVAPIAEDAPAWKMPQSASSGARKVINAPEPQTPPAAEDVFSNNSTPAGTGAMPTVQPSVGGTNLSAMAGQRQLSGSPRVFNGEPISLNLKAADLLDVLRTFAELTGLNMAIDPGVGGAVTVDFTDVPWDQALDIILRQNNLTFVLEGNVMRIGTVQRIADEAVANRRLSDEDRLNVPLTTLSFKLSYARATEVAGLLKDIASPRARIIVDARTNQLIISEIPQFLQTMQNLITTVDIPTRQVMIEARIVESNRTFSQAWGFEWGFDGALDPALGTGTGLVFPNRVGFTGGPFSFTGGAAPVLGFQLSDVLGAFSLDFALNAAEAQGYAKVVSAPRVTTQDNQAAAIESGVQIPYQTRINFTTTIQYINATLSLSVTPQITEAGTVIMEISVQKNEPAVGLAIEGGAGTPITTRTAKTRLMVRDGGTAVIAGIFQTKDNNAVTKIPYVSNIPVIGNLFKSHNIITSHDELLIFITPRIVRG